MDDYEVPSGRWSRPWASGDEWASSLRGPLSFEAKAFGCMPRVVAPTLHLLRHRQKVQDELYNEFLRSRHVSQ